MFLVWGFFSPFGYYGRLFNTVGASMPISSTFTSVLTWCFKQFLTHSCKLLKIGDWNCMQY